MEFLKKLLGSIEPKETKDLPWISLSDIEQLDQIIERSISKIQIVFKYSSRCGINRIMFNRFVEAYNLSETNVDLYYLDIINYRGLSNAIAHKFNIVHESPQVLVIKNGVVVDHASHGAISKIDINCNI